MQTKEILQKVRKIEIKTKRLSDHLFSGEYHTSFKGKGMSFAEVRPYQFGDDIRAIDWNVTARYHEPFVKVFEEERELTLMLMVDVSESLKFGNNKQFKNDIVTEIAATLAFSATTNNDKIGLILFSDEIELYIPPKKGRFHVLRIIRELVQFQPKNTKTNLDTALIFFSKVMKKKAIAFILSDFLYDVTDYEKSLKMVSKKHDVTAIKVNNIREKELPNIGIIQMRDAENQNSIWVNTADAQLRDAYQKHYETQEKQVLNTFARSGTGFIKLFDNVNYVKKLLGYFKSR